MKKMILAMLILILASAPVVAANSYSATGNSMENRMQLIVRPKGEVRMGFSLFPITSVEKIPAQSDTAGVLDKYLADENGKGYVTGTFFIYCDSTLPEFHIKLDITPFVSDAIGDKPESRLNYNVKIDSVLATVGNTTDTVMTAKKGTFLNIAISSGGKATREIINEQVVSRTRELTISAELPADQDIDSERTYSGQIKMTFVQN